jgi:3-oxoacyl-[acyl-carrier protein] reductase
MSIDRMSLQGQVAIVTGSRRGLGKAIALAFAEAGADVAICDIEDDGGEMSAVVKQIKKLGRRAIAVRVDLTKKDQVENFVKKVEAELGPVDILVNNAGGGKDKFPDSFFVDTLEKDWEDYFAANFKTCLLCTQAVSKGMMKRKTGKIINISSIGAELGPVNAYACAKASMNRFTRGAAFDLGKYNIRVNAIEPGATLVGKVKIEKGSPVERFKTLTPLARIPEAEDVSNCALFLASEASRNITGVIIRVDGGYTLGFMEHAKR